MECHTDAAARHGEFGYTRLSDAIYKLKADGWKIKKTIHGGKGRLGNKVHFAAYSLEDEA